MDTKMRTHATGKTNVRSGNQNRTISPTTDRHWYRSIWRRTTPETIRATVWPNPSGLNWRKMPPARSVLCA